MPAVLLMVFSSAKSTDTTGAVNSDNRQIDPNAIKNQGGAVSPSPVSSSPSAVPKPSSPLPDSTKSSGIN